MAPPIAWSGLSVIFKCAISASLRLKALLYPRRDGAQDVAGIERLRGGELRGAIKPAEQRLALGVDIVVNFHRIASLLLRTGYLFEPAFEIQ